MTIKAIKNGRIVLPGSIEENKILLYDKKIIDIVDEVENIEDFEWLDAMGNFVSPGFIDIHIHGAYGFDAMDEEAEAIKSLSQKLCENGVTSFLPTTISMSKEKIHNALNNVRECMKKNGLGAKVLGAHMEGPFINSLKKGAHDEEYIIKPDYEMIKDYFDVIRIITIAPEMDENLEFIKKVGCTRHMALSIGHSNATYEEAMEAIDAGVCSATHAFNAMSPFHHRDPGVVGAILKTDIYCELIADKVHVHPAIFSMLADIKGKNRIILITDSMSAACMKAGTYDLGGQLVEVDSNSARLRDGTLAGSVIRLNEAVRNFKHNTDYDLPNIIKMASLNPARLIGEDKNIGSIEQGKSADLTIFDDNFEVSATIVEGRLCYKGEI